MEYAETTVRPAGPRTARSRAGGGARVGSRRERALQLVEARADSGQLRFHVRQLKFAAAVAGEQRVSPLEVLFGNRAQDVSELASVDVRLDGAHELDERRLGAD